MLYLICDLNIQKQGHYIGYNQYILDNIAIAERNSPEKKYIFLYNTEAQNHLIFPEYTNGKIQFINENCWTAKTTRARIDLFKKVVQYANEKAVDHLIFLDLDQYQLPIFACRFSFKLSGILFRPHHRIIPSNNTFLSKISSKQYRFKKIIAEKFLTLTKTVENIYILNDEEGVKKLNKIHKTSQFKYLPDPIFSYPSLVQKTNDTSTFKFLIFGAINERKNITSIIKAYDAATFNIETELLIVGTAKQEYLIYLESLIGTLSTIKQNKKITIRSSFVTNEEMDSYFSSCNVCLLIYKDFYGSSGLLGRAALHKKKVIGPNVGLLKELIETNTIGITCDPNSTEEIALALEKGIALTINTNNFNDFYKKYSPEVFLATVLS